MPKSIDMNENYQTLAVRFTPEGEIRGMARPALTGKEARDSFAKLAAKYRKNPEVQVALPVDMRARNREQARKDARLQRKGKARYMRRQMLEQSVVNDLQHQFDILDGRREVPAHVLATVRESLIGKRDALIRQDHERFQKEHRRALDAYMEANPDADRFTEGVRQDFGITPVISVHDAEERVRALAGSVAA